MNIMENHFTNIMVILANNEIESKINLMMTHAICCLARSKTKLNILSPHTTCLQPFNKSSIHFLKVLGTKWLVGNLLAQVTISDNPTQLVVGVNVLEAVEWIEEVYRGWKMSAIMFLWWLTWIGLPLEDVSENCEIIADGKTLVRWLTFKGERWIKTLKYVCIHAPTERSAVIFFLIP